MERCGVMDTMDKDNFSWLITHMKNMCHTIAVKRDSMLR
jgi:hypothetical protein